MALGSDIEEHSIDGAGLSFHRRANCCTMNNMIEQFGHWPLWLWLSHPLWSMEDMVHSKVNNVSISSVSIQRAHC